MRAVVQRVARAGVEVGGQTVGAIERGLLVYVGFGRGDTAADRAWVLEKIANLRVFEDEHGKMNRSLREVGGALLLVSQFTLYGNVRRGRRPSYVEAMPPEEAEGAYDAAVREARALGVPVATGTFRADMQVFSQNDGPVTLWIDSGSRNAPDPTEGAGEDDERNPTCERGPRIAE
jgi:D-tyrosyl-tRNA(Tyr) deacylase